MGWVIPMMYNSTQRFLKVFGGGGWVVWKVIKASALNLSERQRESEGDWAWMMIIYVLLSESNDVQNNLKQINGGFCSNK